MSRKALFGGTLVAAGLVTMPVRGGIVTFDNLGGFLDAMADNGKEMKFFEDFSEINLPNGYIVSIMGPLSGGVPNTYFPNGLNALNLSISSVGQYIDYLTILTPDPGGQYFGNADTFVGSNYFSNELILTFSGAPGGGSYKTGIGLDFWDPIGGALVDITVLDNNGNVLSSGAYGGGTKPNFFGVFSSANIGSIIIDAQDVSSEFVTNIRMFEVVPAPGALTLLGIGAVVGTRRRRRD